MAERAVSLWFTVTALLLSVATVGTLSNEWRKSHWCLRERHHASIMEFENFSSVNAKTRRRTPVVIRSSTCAFTFSTPESASTTGIVSDGAAARLASTRTATLFTGANVSATPR